MAPLKTFITIWLVYYLLVVINPIVSIFPATETALVLQLSFIFVIVLWMALLSGLVGGRKKFKPIIWDAVAKRNLVKAVKLTLVLSLIGVLSSAIGKIIIQGIDYSQGLASARYQWMEVGAEREGISSLFSVIGYLLSTTFIISLYYLILFYESLDKKFWFRSLAIVFVLLISSSALIGGRTIILLTFVFGISFWVLRRYRGLPKFKFSFSAKSIIALFVIGTYCFVGYIFALRAEATGFSSVEYMENMLSYMGAKPTGFLMSITSSPGLVADFIAYNVLIITYLTHSLYTMAAIVAHGSEETNILFAYIKALIDKIGVLDLNTSDTWFSSGRFPSLPGAIYHDFGMWGLLIGANILGLISALTGFIVRLRQPSVFVDGFFSCLLVVLFLSPLLSAIDVLSFPFIAFEFFAISIITPRIKLEKVNG